MVARAILGPRLVEDAVLEPVLRTLTGMVAASLGRGQVQDAPVAFSGSFSHSRFCASRCGKGHLRRALCSHMETG